MPNSFKKNYLLQSCCVDKTISRSRLLMLHQQWPQLRKAASSRKL
jgi:hypothetical protein